VEIELERRQISARMTSAE